MNSMTAKRSDVKRTEKEDFMDSCDEKIPCQSIAWDEKVSSYSKVTLDYFALP